MQSQPQNFLKSLRENWFVILFLASIIIGWNNYSNRVSNVESVQAEQKISIKSLTDQTSKLENTIIEMKANYIFIKDALAELKSQR